MDFLNRRQEHKDLDIEKILTDVTNSFISNYQKRIIQRDERGNKCCVFSFDMLGKFIKTLSRSIDSSVSSYIQQNYLSETKEVSNNEIMSALTGIVGSVERIENEIINGTTFSLEGRPEQYYILPKLRTDQETMSKSLTAILGRIDSLVNSQQDIIKHNSKVIEEQHNRILRYENDVLFKSKKELIMELISLLLV